MGCDDCEMMRERYRHFECAPVVSIFRRFGRIGSLLRLALAGSRHTDTEESEESDLATPAPVALPMPVQAVLVTQASEGQLIQDQAAVRGRLCVCARGRNRLGPPRPKGGRAGLRFARSLLSGTHCTTGAKPPGPDDHPEGRPWHGGCFSACLSRNEKIRGPDAVPVRQTDVKATLRL